ncbi:CapA family protein [Hamadaea tsunoensis]|uniref:CapA family protein n=1 Tax=Hamadaea tsunoensis TaxID=53368 RepID=UPI00068578EA|nr:CapA family protein [Hamadaea tsunoensis]
MRRILPIVLCVALTACTPTASPVADGSPTGSASGTPAAVAGQSPAAAAPKTITLVAAGDVLAHPEIWQQATRDGGYAPMFAGVRPVVSGADLALCHLETPLAPAGGPFKGFPRFSVPPQILDGVKDTGFDGCSTVSNHTLDQGEAGIDRTIAAMDAEGLGHAGIAARPQDAGKPWIYTVRGVKIAHLAYAFGFNGLTPPAGREWLASRIDPAKIKAAAHAARLAGAQIVIVSLHWGTEYRHDPDSNQLAWANALAGSPDIDLVLGHHAHVVQPIRRIKGTWFVFGMGNELARHADPQDANREGLMVRVTFAYAGRWSVRKIDPLPTWVDLAPSIRLVDLTAALADPALDPARRATYQAAYDRVMKYAALAS